MVSKNDSINLGLKLKKLRSNHALTQTGMGKILGVSQQQVANLESGSAQLDIAKMYSLMTKFNLTPAFFFQTNQLEPYAERELLWLPVFEGVPCGHFADVRSEAIDQMPTPRSVLNGLAEPDQNAFWVQTIGDSMAPKIKHNDIVLVAQDVFINNGDLVICYIDEMVTLKRYADKGDKILLIPENQPDYHTMEINKNDLEGRQVKIYKVLRIMSKP